MYHDLSDPDNPKEMHSPLVQVTSVHLVAIYILSGILLPELSQHTLYTNDYATFTVHQV